MRFIAGLNITSPKRFQIAAEFTLTSDLRRAMESEPLDVDRIKVKLFKRHNRAASPSTSRRWNSQYGVLIEGIAQRFDLQPDDLAMLRDLQRRGQLGSTLPFPINFWMVQNVYFWGAARGLSSQEGTCGRTRCLREEWVSRFGSWASDLACGCNWWSLSNLPAPTWRVQCRSERSTL